MRIFFYLAIFFYFRTLCFSETLGGSNNSTPSSAPPRQTQPSVNGLWNCLNKSTEFAYYEPTLYDYDGRLRNPFIKNRKSSFAFISNGKLFYISSHELRIVKLDQESSKAQKKLESLKETLTDETAKLYEQASTKEYEDLIHRIYKNLETNFTSYKYSAQNNKEVHLSKDEADSLRDAMCTCKGNGIEINGINTAIQNISNNPKIKKKEDKTKSFEEADFKCVTPIV